MNKENSIIIRLHQAMIILRECFDYALHNVKITKSLHKKRAEFFQKFVDDTLLPQLLKSNDEVKDKFMKQLNAFNDDIFINNKCFLYDSDELYRTDEDYRIPLIEYLIGIYQTLCDIVDSVISQVKNQGKVNSLVEQVIYAEKNLYSSKSLFVTFSEIVRLSQGLNQLIKNAKTEADKTQIQFQVNELKKLVSLIRFVEAKYTLDKEEIKQVFPLINRSLRLMDGSDKANNEDINKSVRQTITYLVGLDQIYSVLFVKIFNDLLSLLKQNESKDQPASDTNINKEIQA